MTDVEFLDRMQTRSNETLIHGCVIQHCWLGYTAKQMERAAGSWAVSIRVDDLDRLIEMARKGATYD
jgi:hypothetical protein